MSTPAFDWPYPALIAHRGGGRHAPENTLAAMRLGASQGYTFVEYDVKLTRDNVLVLMHDDTVDRCTNGQGRVADMTYAELSQLDAGSWHSPEFAGERVPTFEAVVQFLLANGIASNVEIKPSLGHEAATGTAVALACRTLWANASVPPLLSSFSEVALAAAHVAAPELPRALLLSEPATDWRDRMVQHDCVALNINQRRATPELIAAVHDAGYRMAAYTVNDVARAKQLREWGMDGIFTDELVAMRDVAGR